MSKVRSLRLVVTLFAVGAVFAVSILPAEHLHAEHSGSSLVHRHVVDNGPEHAESAFNHGDHSSVTTLDPTFNSQRPFDIDRPLISAQPAVAATDRRFAVLVDRSEAARTHGPPIRVRSLRAPPA